MHCASTFQGVDVMAERLDKSFDQFLKQGKGKGNGNGKEKAKVTEKEKSSHQQSLRDGMADLTVTDAAPAQSDDHM